VSQRQRILRALPATVCELAALEETTVRLINAQLCRLRSEGLAVRTKSRGMRYGKRGPCPAFWMPASADVFFRIRANFKKETRDGREEEKAQTTETALLITGQP